MARIPDDPSTLELAVWTIVSLGAINWALFAVWDFNAVVFLLGAANAAPAYIVIGALGAVDLADLYGVIDL